MHTSMILDTWLCCMCVWCGWNFVPDEQGDSRSRMHIYMYYAYTYMLLDHYAYVLDALMYDAYICDPWYLTMLHVCMMRLKFCHQRTDKAIVGVGCRHCSPWNINCDHLNKLGILSKFACSQNVRFQNCFCFPLGPFRPMWVLFST